MLVIVLVLSYLIKFTLLFFLFKSKLSFFCSIALSQATLSLTCKCQKSSLKSHFFCLIQEPFNSNMANLSKEPDNPKKAPGLAMTRLYQEPENSKKAPNFFRSLKMPKRLIFRPLKQPKWSTDSLWSYRMSMWREKNIVKTVDNVSDVT